MKNYLLTIIISCFSAHFYSQVGINTTAPNAQLDIRSSNQATPANTDGVLIPKIDAFPGANPTLAQQGMLVYLTTAVGANQPGFYYWNNPTTSWIGIAGGGGSGWELSGNTGTSPFTNFVGTLDDNDLIFRRNNIRSGLLNTTHTSFGVNAMPVPIGQFNTAIGNNALNAINNISSINNTAVGHKSMENLSFGLSNSALGAFSLNTLTQGVDNAAFGSSSLFTLNIGSQNTALGFASSSVLENGTGNTSLGAASLSALTDGSQNTALGRNALDELTNGVNNIGIGFQANVFNPTGSDQLSIANSIFGTNMGLSTSLVGIDIPNPTSKLHVNGELRIGSTLATAATVGAGGLRWDGTNIQYSNGTAWNNFGGGGSGWSLTGNSGTVAGTNFIGTTDNINLNFRRNNIASGFINANDTSFGYNSSPNPTTNGNNTAFGARTLFTNNNNASTVNNTAAGNEVLYSLTQGFQNSGFGAESLYSLGTGDSNTAVGRSALTAITTGNNNVAIGSTALSSSTEGDNNIGIGQGVQVPNLTGSNQLTIGNSIYGLGLGTTNPRIGINTTNPSQRLHVAGNLRLNGAFMPGNSAGTAGQVLTSAGAGLPPTWAAAGGGGGGSGWLLTGNALSTLNDGFEFIGTTNLSDIFFKRNNVHAGTISDFDTALGVGALSTDLGVSGKENTAIGYFALNKCSDLSYGNTAIGAQSLKAMSTSVGQIGNYNIAVGYQANQTRVSGNNNIVIGVNAVTPTVDGDNQVRIGNTGQTYYGAQVAWTITSDKRWKNTITDSNLGLSFISKLRPVSYFRNNDETKKLEYGLIAQELKQALKEHNVENSGIVFESDDSMLGVRYNDLMAPMIKAIQELKEQNEALAKKVEELEKLVKK